MAQGYRHIESFLNLNLIQILINVNIKIQQSPFQQHHHRCPGICFGYRSNPKERLISFSRSSGFNIGQPISCGMNQAVVMNDRHGDG